MNYKEKQELALLNDIASILAIQNEQKFNVDDKIDQSKLAVKQLESDFSNVLGAQNQMINSLEEDNNDSVNDLISSIDNILSCLNENDIKFDNDSIETIDVGESWNEFYQNNIYYAQNHNIDLTSPYMKMFTNNELAYFNREMIEKFDICELDQYDYAFAVSCGIIAGLIDVFLVGTISQECNDSKLVNAVDGAFDKIVMKHAKTEKIAQINDNRAKALLAHPENSGNINSKFDSLINDVSKMEKKECISFLEKNHRVSYDVSTSFVNDVGEKVLDGLNPSNHHLFSLAHSPGIEGLLFGIIDQLTGKATIINPKTGVLERVVTANKQKDLGTGSIERIINAIKNWYGHTLSDIAGSHSSAKRGAGLPVPGSEALQRLHFGKIPINGKELDFAEVSQWMYKNGYDVRAFTAQMIPVLINECLVRLYWFCKQKFYFGKPLKESIPLANQREVARLLLVATSVFSAMDLGHAFVKSGGVSDFATFIMTINIPGLADFGLRCIQNIRFEVEHRKYVEKVLDEDIKKEWERILA